MKSSPFTLCRITMITKNKKGSGKKALRANKKMTLKWSSIVNQIIQLNSQHWEMETNLSAAAAAKSLQLCPTLCDPTDSSPPGSSVPGILQARTLEWVAISFSNAWKEKVKMKSLSHVRLLATHGLQPTRLLHPWDFPGKSGVPSPSPKSVCGHYNASFTNTVSAERAID